MDNNKTVMVICFNQYIKGLMLTIYKNNYHNPFILQNFDIEKIQELVTLFEVEEIMLCGPIDFTSKYEQQLKDSITIDIKTVH